MPPVQSTAEADGICLHLLQLHGADNGHLKRMPWKSLQAVGTGENVQGLLLCGAPTQKLPYGGSLEGSTTYHPLGSVEGAV